MRLIVVACGLRDTHTGVEIAGYAIAQNRQYGYWHLWCGGLVAIASPCLGAIAPPSPFTIPYNRKINPTRPLSQMLAWWLGCGGVGGLDWQLRYENIVSL